MVSPAAHVAYTGPEQAGPDLVTERDGETFEHDPVAIVGIGCRYPGGIEDPRSFWELIASGTDAIVETPEDRWDADAFFDADPATPSRMLVREGGFLRAPVDRFDAGFFGMPPREAAALDPQQRLLLEVTWEAFEDAGIPPSSTAAANVGTYIGGFTFDAATHQLSEANRHLVSAATSTGVSMTILSARLSYVFDWRGPCLTMDTACSSSLVAVHQACAALARGECDLAVAGGVNVMVNPVTTILMSKGQFLSPDARCRSFDHRANGYVRGEGAGIVVLKPLAAAERDGDHVYAVVRGTAVNQDGRTPGITVPSAEAQRAVIRQACRIGGVAPDSVGYFEAHGTGTAVGDPIEATAIGEVLGDSIRTHCIGSVKSNIGHTEAAAGVAGVIKASLCLERGLIPPNLHFERPNPNIPFDTLPLRVPTEMVPFPQQSGPRRAGVNSFGFGGTNAHAVLEQAPGARPAANDEHDDGSPQLLVLSARSPEALRAQADAYATLLEQPEGPALQRVCRAASRQRDHHPLRTFVVAGDPAQAAEQLRQMDVSARRATHSEVAFVYTGMGPQWWGMGRELLREEPRFAEVVAACDEVLERFGMSISDELLREEESSRLTETLYAQVANFVVQAGLTALWRDWGVEPALIVGHSVGEVAAAYAAGVYSLEDALAVSFHRASLQARLAGRGGMAAVDVPAEAVRQHLVEGVDIAAVNSRSSTTLSGDPDAMNVVTERLRDSGASVKVLRVEVAYHSHQMDEIHEPLLAALRGIRPREARIPLFSTVTGDGVKGTELDAGYWWGNVRQPVRFAAAIRKLLAFAPDAVLEVGPHPVLATAIDEALAERGSDAVRLASLRRDRPQRQQVLETLGGLYACGVELDWQRVHPGPRERLELPRYPWQRERHWVESAASRQARLGADGPRLGGRAVAAATPVRDVELSAAEFPYLADHRIGQTVVFPGSGYLEAALAMFPDDVPCVLEDVVFQRPLALQARSITTLRIGYDPDHRLVTLHSRGQDDEAVWTLHAQLRRPDLARPRLPQPRTETLAELTRALTPVGHDEVYAQLDGSNLNYGPAFRAVDQLWYREETGEVFAELSLDTVDARGYRLHPALLDAALQAVIAGALRFSKNARGATYVPASIGELRFFRSPGKRLWLHGSDRRSTVPGRLECDLTLVTDGGEVVAEVIGLRAQRLAEDDTEQQSGSQELYYEHAWHPEQLEGTGDAESTWIVVSSPANAAVLDQGLSERGGKVLHIAPSGQEWPAEVVAALGGDSTCRGVIHVSDAGVRDAPACAPVTTPLQLVQALSGIDVPLFLVTSGAQSVSPDDATTDPSAASVWGFGRVVNAERPELRCRLIDVDAEVHVAADRVVEALLAEFTHDALDEVALRGGSRYVRRLEHAADRSPLRHVSTRTDSTPVRLRNGHAGLDGLGFEATGRRSPGPNEVEIEVAYAGLNFKDVLKATGLLDPEAMEGSLSRETLGLECSGTVLRVGEVVSGLRPGDEVFAHSRDLFGSHVTLDEVRVVKKPTTLSLAQAASLLPAVTAHQSLVRLAGVRRGDRVLVHSGAGGVGLAAVRIAMWLGAEVYATAGSEQRRELLRREGVAGVSDSRSTAFADDILRWTDGAGVDVVVNSLSGEALHKSIGLLRPFGRFVELGKADIAADHALRLAPFHRALSFHAFDYDQMMLLDPERVRTCMREVADLYDEGAVAPLPVTEVPAAEVATAFRAMTHSEHNGKIVVRVAREPVAVPASSITESPISHDGTYVITGGLGGLGLAVSAWLADRGARHLVLTGRRGIATPEAERAVADLTGRGVEVRVEQADVGDRDLMEGVFERVRAQMPPVRGIIHAAADFDDVVLSDTDAARLVAATRPKADGAWNLHLLSESCDLDFFVLFSSVAAQIGAAAAGAYATANEFLNALARYRRARGLPATSVGWGMIDEVGVAVSRNGTVGNVLRRNGHIGLPPARLVAELEALVRTAPVEASVADIDWKRWAQANPQLAPLPRYRTLVPAAGPDAGGQASVPERLRNATSEERAALLPELVTPLLQRITGLSDQQLDDQQAVDIDSLAAVELRVLLQNTLGVAVPAVRLQRDLTVTSLAGLLADELERAPVDTFRPLEDIVMHEFVSSDGLTIYGHLSLPAGPGPHPAVVVCTSGEGGALDDEGRYAHISEHTPLHAAGFAVFTVDQRGAPGHGADYRARPEMGGLDIDDVVAAARYIAELPEIDAARMSVLGTSRGGSSALLALAREPSVWHRAVLIMGLYDPGVLMAAEQSSPGALLPERAETGSAEVNAYLAAPQRQPMSLLEAVTTPLLLVHGDSDEIVPVAQAHHLADRAQQLGLPAQLVTVPGLGHDNDHAGEPWVHLWPEIARFLSEDPR
ncbi:type I polyketide synthase [Saccharopolyspora erythraea]|uniref:type I polyketide synthase n=1 Tax=Saccharopolyspora erythraea TaxID=1836 RepID=UPI0004142DAB|nr:type I polyketide synthase [Saccharopolyspora erythraea]QRK92240.1 type I polyketide synthase [Saccharopolyspora erythraea]